MMRGALVSTLLCGTSALAEGRNDPFLRCVFDDGRDVILAENGDAVEWREANGVTNVVQSAETNDKSLRTFIRLGEHIERLDVFAGPMTNDGMSPQIGDAFLSGTNLGSDGSFLSLGIDGSCEAYSG